MKVRVLFAVLFTLLRVNAEEAPKGHTSLPIGSGLQRLAARDLIAVEVYNFPELSLNVRVSEDGTIQLPMLPERLVVQGLLSDEAAAAIATKVKEQGLVEHPRVTVSIVELGSAPVRVLGAVHNPVGFQASAHTSLSDAIIQAGGFLPEAGNEIVVTRAAAPDENPEKLYISRLRLLAGDQRSNIELRGGEEIRVPYAGRIYVLGEVKSPGAYPIQDGNSSTVLQTVAQAGGLTTPARNEAYVIREDGGTGKRREVPVPLKRIFKRDAADVPLMAGDILYIPENRSRKQLGAVLDRILMFGTRAGTTAMVF